MASTYTLNNGIELIGTGEQSGTWGDTTNTNFELIDTALDGQISLTLSSAGSSGSPNALPVSDGASSNGRNRLISYVDGGDLGATVYVQLTPNDAEKIIYIKNALSGSRSIIVFQGTYNASNDYEIPAGKTAVVYFNGGGTGAVAANVFNNAHFDALNVVGDATIAGTLNVGTVEFDSLSGTGSVAITDILDEDNMASNSATKLATQQSIKTYVDTQVATADTLTEVLGNGNTTATDQKIQFRDNAIYINSSADGQLDLVADTEIQIAATTIDINGAINASGEIIAASLDISGDIDVDGTTNLDVVDIDGAVSFASTTAHADHANFVDNARVVFGNGSDLQIYTNGTDSFIDETSAGWLYIRGNNTVIGKYTGETYIKGVADGTVELYHDNTKKIETTASGVSVAGDVVLSGTVDGVDIQTLNTTANAALPKAGGTMTGNATFGDNNKAIFGAGSDLQIFHNGGNSFVQDTGTGNLYLAGSNSVLISDASASETMATFNLNGSVDLYHDNAIKLATTATGIDVTGEVASTTIKLGGTAVTSTATEINQLDAITRGSIIYGNASGATARLAAGNADQVLTSDGTDISWADAGGGGSTIGSVQLSAYYDPGTLDGNAGNFLEPISDLNDWMMVGTETTSYVVVVPIDQGGNQTRYKYQKRYRSFS